jgi:hypothetical protein
MSFRLFFIPCVLAMLIGESALGEGPQLNRVLKLIDFEERQLGNNEDLPMHWAKISGDGLPHYVNGILSNDRAHNGEYSFRFTLNGGSLVYRYDPKQITITPGARYRVQCYCQTTVMPNARARLTAYFMDQDMRLLPDVVRHSELYTDTSNSDGWKQLFVELNADNPNAMYMAIELELLQPQLYSPRSLGDRTIWPQDINGTAWFDDVSVSQVPQVTLTTDHPGNIFGAGDAPKLTVDVNDLFTNDLQSRLTIVDTQGRTVYQRSGAMSAQAAGPEQVHKHVIVGLPKLPAGWYRANLEMNSHGRDLGMQTTAFVQLADAAEPMPPDPRFGVIATDLPVAGLQQLPTLLPLMSAGRVKLAIWSPQHSIDETDSPAFDSLLEEFDSDGITPTGCLAGLPPEIAKQVGGKSWLRLLQAGPDTWQPQAAYLVSRHASELEHWQVGLDGDDSFVTDSEMRRVYTMIHDQFAKLVPDPDVAMPWSAWYDLDKRLPRSLAMSIPAMILPEQIPLYLHDLINRPEGGQHSLSISLQLLDDRYGHMVRLRDLAQRVMYCLAGGADRIDLPVPFVMKHSGDQWVVEPDELFIIERTLMRTLGGADYKGRIVLADGIEAMLFDKGGQGILAVWSRDNSTQNKQFALNLSQQTVVLDLWGNVTPLTHVDDNVQMSVGPLPVFLIGVDGISAQLRASVAFDQPLLESSFQTHIRTLSFTNPDSSTITGTLHVRPPSGWSMTPATCQFALNAGQIFSQPITIEFPYNSMAGPKDIVAEITLEGESTSKFNVPLTLTLGLSDVGMHTVALRNGKDLLVQETITNYGERSIDYTAYATYPGATRQERLIGGLEPGRTTIKLYRFKNVKFIPGALVRCGIRQLEGTKVLNDEAEIR